MKKILLVLFFLSGGQLLYGQFYERNDRKIVFENESLREKASSRSHVIQTLKQGTEIIICKDKSYVADTIDGLASYWTPVLFNDSKGYIWGGNFCSNTFSHSNGSKLLWECRRRF